MRPRIPPRTFLQRFSRGAKTYQTGFELPPAPESPVEATGQELRFDDDCSQPDSTDAEPVFWTGGAEQSDPADDFVQAEALESV